MPSVNAIKITVGTETTPGSAVTPTAVIPVKSAPSLKRVMAYSDDPAILGQGMSAGGYATEGNVSGNVPLAPRACAGFGKLIKAALGAEATPVETPGILRIAFQGAQASCKIVADATTHTIKSYIGALGAEVADTDFGTAGTIDVQNASYNTLAKLLQALNAAFITFGTVVNGDTVAVQYGTNAAVTFTKAAATLASARQFADAAGLVTCINDATYGVAGVTASGTGPVKLIPADYSKAIALTVSSTLTVKQYRGYKEFGTDTTSLSAASVVTDSAIQAAGKHAIVILTGSGSGAYAHVFTPDLSISNERPALSIQKDGYGDNYIYAGCSVNSLSLSAQIKAFLEGEAEILGMTELGGQTASVVSAPTAQPLQFVNGITAIGGTIFNFTKSLAVKIANNLRQDGYGQSSLDRSFHQKGLFSVEGDVQLRLDSSSLLLRAKMMASTLCSIQARYSGGLIGSAGGQETLIIEMPYVSITGFEEADSSGQFDAKLNIKARNPGTGYDPAMTMILVTADSGAY